MPVPTAEFINAPCPFLPGVDRQYRSADVAALGEERGAAFYLTSLRYAQSQWQLGLPAQAMLQVNRAFACVLPSSEPVLAEWPLPYRAMAWLMGNRLPGQFLGNPRRHFQHLATRMVEPHKELRTWRAWACWYLAGLVLPAAEFPGDARQIRAEGIIEPRWADIAAQLRRLSSADDEAQWLEAVAKAGGDCGDFVEARVETLGVADLPRVQALARAIWPVVYPGIISLAQIDYMLERMYALPVLEADAARGVCFAGIFVGAEMIGYLACEPMPAIGELFLHKLYLLPEHAGRGHGAQALAWVKNFAQQRGLSAVVLRVNKANAKAIRAYRRAGFAFRCDMVTDFGAGFVMDDHEMALACG